MRVDKPLTSKQLKEGDLIPKGIYNFQVMTAEEQISQAGNDMIKLQLKIWLEDGRERTIFDYLLEAMEWKLGHFCEVADLVEQYNAKNVQAVDCIGKCGSLKVGIKVDKSGQYTDKNTVLDYLPEPKRSLSNPIKSDSGKPDFQDSDIPF